MAFQKVQRKAAKMRVAVAGPSGAGKTLSALYLAYGVTGDWAKSLSLTRNMAEVSSTATAVTLRWANTSIRSLYRPLP